MNFHKSHTQEGSIQKMEIRTKGKRKHRGAKSERKNEKQLTRDITKNEIIYKYMSSRKTINKEAGIVFNRECN